MFSLTPQQRELASYWLPALASGALAWLSFVTLGHTPLIRSTGLALVIVGVALTIRRLGAAFAITGGLALAYCPAFWSQTGGGESAAPATIVIALVTAGAVTLLLAWLANRPMLGFGFGLVIFAVIFWSQIGTPRSLRLTGLLTAWQMYLLINTLRVTHPRPDDPPRGVLDQRYTMAALLVLIVGVINDPLFVLLAPAVALTLYLAAAPRWQWPVVAAVVMVGIRGIVAEYVNPNWWSLPAQAAVESGLHVPYLIADGWRVGARWLDVFNLVIGQFTVAGFVLGVVGLARLARWYPVMGIVSLVAYAAYAVFGLVYFGLDRPILLLPMLIIQIIWMTYAVFAFGYWVQKSETPPNRPLGWLAPAAFVLMPVFLFLRIAT